VRVITEARLIAQAALGVALGVSLCVLPARPEPAPLKLLPYNAPAEASTQNEAAGPSPWKDPNETPALSVNFSPYYLEGADPELQTGLSEETIRNALAAVRPFADTIRTFGSSGELGMEKLYRPAKEEYGFRIIAGCWLGGEMSESQIQEELRLLAELGNEGLADILVVGSEGLMRGDYGPKELIGWISKVRAMLERPVPVGISDTAGELLENPEVMHAADVAMFTHYPYFNGVTAEKGVADFEAMLRRLRHAAGGAELICSETGWKFEADNAENASPENAARYFEEIIELGKSENLEIIYFESITEPWKEKHLDGGWGLLGTDLKPREAVAAQLGRIAEELSEEGA
jgi:exo-beta-1,3-glucanase (GH17 family)